MIINWHRIARVVVILAVLYVVFLVASAVLVGHNAVHGASLGR